MVKRLLSYAALCLMLLTMTMGSDTSADCDFRGGGDVDGDDCVFFCDED